jgi:hypothetical protein
MMARQYYATEGGELRVIGTTAGTGEKPKAQYSADETFTGEYWADDKPIYRRTFDLKFTDSTAALQALDGSGTIDSVVRSEVCCLLTSGSRVLGPVYYGGADPATLAFIVQVVVDSGKRLGVWRNIIDSGYLNYVYRVTAWYTKTTD